MTDIYNQFPWYSIVKSSENVEQGDMIDNFPVPVVYSLEDKNQIAVSNANIIIMTQSCDLENVKEEQVKTFPVVVCMRYSINEAEINGKKYNNKDMWKSLTAGRILNSHLLNKCDIQDYEFDYQIVQLSQIVTVSLDIVRSVIQKREAYIRLQPPYREHLAQAFARQFMRVGLPLPLPKEYPYQKT